MGTIYFPPYQPGSRRKHQAEPGRSVKGFFKRLPGSISGLGRSPGGGHGNPLQCACLENPMDRGVWRATVHGVTKSLGQNFHFSLALGFSGGTGDGAAPGARIRGSFYHSQTGKRAERRGLQAGLRPRVEGCSQFLGTWQAAGGRNTPVSSCSCLWVSC